MVKRDKIRRKNGWVGGWVEKEKEKIEEEGGWVGGLFTCSLVRR